MAIIKGYNGKVLVGANPVGQVMEFDFEPSVERMDATVMGQPFEKAAGGLTGGTVAIRCILDPADTTGQGALTEGAEVSLQLRPDGDGTGKPQYAFDAVIESVPLTQTTREHVRVDFNGWVNSAVDRTAQT